MLGRLRADGLRAPLLIDRALEKLIDLGLVHRLEPANAFVACSHPTCCDHITVAFEVGDDCGQVDEAADERLTLNLKEAAVDCRFVLRQSIVELRGTCNDCASMPVDPQ